MVELTDLNNNSFILNCYLIETISSIPETKVTLTNGKYFLVKEEPQQVVNKVIEYEKKLKGGNRKASV